MDVSVIVVSYNTKDLTKSCLDSVFEMTEGVDFEVIVVDNASADGSAAMIRESFPRVELIESGKNLGFAAANNLAIRRATGTYVFLLNPDTLLLNNAVRAFYEFMEDRRNQKVGAVGTYLLDKRGRIQHSYGEFVTLRDFGYGLDIPKIVRRVRRQWTRGLRLARRLLRMTGVASEAQKREVTTRPLPARKRVDYVTGADLFLRKRVLDEIGAFDERFFLYAEEMDLQYRMRRAGYERLVIAGPEILHHQTQSMSQPERRRLLESAKLEFLRKHFLLKYAACRLARRLKLQSSSG